MKKILLSALALATIVPVCAQNEPTVPYIFTEIAENTYGITKDLTTVQAEYDNQWVATDAWNLGVKFPAGTVMFENDDLIMTAACGTPVYVTTDAAGQLIGDIQKYYPQITGYVNAGSTLNQNNWTGNEEMYFIADLATSNHGIIQITPKKDGKLGFSAFAGDNSRAIGIMKEVTMEEAEAGITGKWIDYVNFRNDGGEADLSNEPVEYERGELDAPATVEGDVTAGSNYGLIAGGGRNVNLAVITFVPGEGTGINNVVTDTTAAPTDGKIYTIDGRYVGTDKAALSKGLYIQNGKKFIVK